MRRLLFPLLLTFIVLPALAAAECTAPDTPGVRICSPTANATVADGVAIDFNSTPSFGAQISKYIVYDNNVKLYQGPPGETGTFLMDGSIKNGLNKIVINAWDTEGNLYQGRVNFTVVGDAFPPCAVPSSPGVNFCGPPAGAELGVRYSVYVAAKGNSKITAMKLYVDGKQQEGTFTDFYGDPSFSTPVLVSSQGDHKVTFNAWDSGGHVFSSSRTIRSTYTRGYEECAPKGNSQCLAGFDESSTPGPNSYVESSFPINASIINNTEQITNMKAWIDNTVVATSNGPTLMANIENAPSGTHILTLQAWEATGVTYRIQYNLNINVPH
jgi:hypothetical protein